MKQNYLDELRTLLDGYVMPEEEKVDIISDYDDLYENYLAKGMNDDEIREKLGNPRNVISSLVYGYKRVPKPISKGNKIIAITPFIALVLFFIGGFAFDLWLYSWMAFLIIPITAITVELVNSKDENVFNGITPFIAVIAYFIMGMEYNLWHPGWVVFLIIPVVAIALNRKTMTFLNLVVALSPFAAIVAFIYLGEQGYWQQGWLVFLGIPMIAVLNEKNIVKVIVWELLFAVGILGYLYIGETYGEWNYALLSFVPVVAWGILIGDITIGFVDAPRNYKIIIVASGLVYILLGFAFGWWGYAWLVFLSIPVYAIQTEVEGKEKIIATTPFIAVTLFILLGAIFDIWEYAWLVFLIIPVTAIVLEVE